MEKRFRQDMKHLESHLQAGLEAKPIEFDIIFSETLQGSVYEAKWYEANAVMTTKIELHGFTHFLSMGLRPAIIIDPWQRKKTVATSIRPRRSM